MSFHSALVNIVPHVLMELKPIWVWGGRHNPRHMCIQYMCHLFRIFVWSGLLRSIYNWMGLQLSPSASLLTTPCRLQVVIKFCQLEVFFIETTLKGSHCGYGAANDEKLLVNVVECLSSAALMNFHLSI